MPEKYGYLYRSNMSLPRHGIRDYISNGLICHLDGIDNTGNGHDSHAAVWRDLSGNGNSFTIYGCSWRDDRLHFIPDTYALGTQMNPSAISVELVCDIQAQTSDSVCIIANQQAGGVIMEVYSGQLRFRCHNGSEYVPIYVDKWPNTAFCVSITFDENAYSVYIDSHASETLPGGILAPAALSTVWALGTNPLRSDSENNRARFTGDIYSVRIYDRALSAPEIQYNHRLDVLRFM